MQYTEATMTVRMPVVQWDGLAVHDARSFLQECVYMLFATGGSGFLYEDNVNEVLADTAITIDGHPVDRLGAFTA